MKLKINVVILTFISITALCFNSCVIAKQIDWTQITVSEEDTVKVAKTDQFTTRQNEILRQVIAVGNDINEDLHREFWSTVSWSIVSGKNGKKELEFIRNIASTAGAYQKELWRCVASSYKNKQITKTERLNNLYNSYVTQFKRQDYIAKENSIFKSFIQQMNYNLHGADQLLSAAAQHKPWHANNLYVEITPELINIMLNGINSSTSRLIALMTPQYYDSVMWHQAEGAVKQLDLLSLNDKKMAFSIIETKVSNNYAEVENANFNSANPKDKIWELKIKGFQTAKLYALAKRMDWPEMAQNYLTETKAIMAIVNKKVQWDDYILVTKKITKDRIEIRNKFPEPLRSGPFTLSTKLYKPTNKIAIFIAVVAKWNA